MTGTVLHLLDSSARNRWLEEIFAHADRARWPIVVASLQLSGPLQQHAATLGIPSFSLEAASRRAYPRAVLRLRRYLGAHPTAIIHSHQADPTLVSLLATVGRRRPLRVYTRHQQPGFFDLAPLAAWKRRGHVELDRVTTRAADAVIAPTAAVADEAIARGARQGSVHEIPLGYELRAIAPDPGLVARLRDDLRLNGRLSGVCVGRLAWEKDHETTLRAWAEVRRTHPAAILLVVGDGPRRADLERLSAELGIGDGVTFVGHRSDVPALMAASDVVIHTSLTESTGQVLLEALALGRPLVSTPVGVVGQYLRDGVHCVVVPFGDSVAAAKAINRIAADPEMARGLGDAGRAVVLDVFDIDPMVRAYEAVYDSLLEDDDKLGLRSTTQ